MSEPAWHVADSVVSLTQPAASSALTVSMRSHNGAFRMADIIVETPKPTFPRSAAWERRNPVRVMPI